MRLVFFFKKNSRCNRGLEILLDGEGLLLNEKSTEKVYFFLIKNREALHPNGSRIGYVHKFSRARILSNYSYNSGFRVK